MCATIACQYTVGTSRRGDIILRSRSPRKCHYPLFACPLLKKTLCNFEPQIWPEMITSRDAESTCFKGSRTSCDVIIFLAFLGPNIFQRRSHHVMDAFRRFRNTSERTPRFVRSGQHVSFKWPRFALGPMSEKPPWSLCSETLPNLVAFYHAIRLRFGYGFGSCERQKPKPRNKGPCLYPISPCWL